MDEQTPRSKSPNQTINSPEVPEAGAEPPSGSRMLGQDDRWMSKQRALSPKQNTNSPEATEAGAEPLQALESSVRMTDG